MAKLAYILGAYQNYRVMVIALMTFGIILTPILCLVRYSELDWGGKEDDPEMIWLKLMIKISAVLLIVNLFAVVYTPTTLSMEEIIIEKAEKIEGNTKSNDELRSYFNNIIGHEEEKEEKK